MDINSSNIEQIVRQVLESMNGKTVAPAAAGAIPATAHVAMLTSLEKFEVKEYMRIYLMQGKRSLQRKV